MSESGVFQRSTIMEDGSVGRYSDPELIYSSGKSKLYRMKLRGKYFLAKTYSENNLSSFDMLRREYEIIESCSHPNIVHVFTLAPSTPVGEAIIMDYIEGRTLNEFLEEHPSKKEKEKIIDQLLSAVNYLHRRGITHNDLKPDNILVSLSDNSLRLIDFDFADDPAHYLIKTPGCTPSFAAPELREKGSSDSRSDIYSIGLIIRHLFGDNYKYISSKCLKKDPEKRFQSVTDLQQKWAEKDKRLSGKTFLWIFSAAVLVTAIYFFAAYKTEVSSDYEISSDIKAEDNGRINNNKEITESINEEPEASPTLASSIPNIQWEVNKNGNSGAKDKILKRFDDLNKNILTNTFQKIRNSKYYEFTILIPQQLVKEVEDNYNDYLENCKDSELKDKLLQQKMVFLSGVGEKLRSEMEKLPTLSSKKNEISEEERQFYHQLLYEGQPYKDFSEEN